MTRTIKFNAKKKSKMFFVIPPARLYRGATKSLCHLTSIREVLFFPEPTFLSVMVAEVEVDPFQVPVIVIFTG